MKPLFYLIAFSLILLLSCKKNSDNTSATSKKDSTVVKDTNSIPRDTGYYPILVDTAYYVGIFSQHYDAGTGRYAAFDTSFTDTVLVIKKSMDSIQLYHLNVQYSYGYAGNSFSYAYITGGPYLINSLNKYTGKHNDYSFFASDSLSFYSTNGSPDYSNSFGFSCKRVK